MITGQMRIEEILQEKEGKGMPGKPIEVGNRKIDDERTARSGEALEKRKEAESCEVERKQRKKWHGRVRKKRAARKAKPRKARQGSGRRRSQKGGRGRSRAPGKARC